MHNTIDMSSDHRKTYSIELKYLKELQDIKNRNLINKIRAYDTEMLHRVHKLRKRLKKETDPKIRRKLLKKYNELTKIIN